MGFLNIRTILLTKFNDSKPFKTKRRYNWRFREFSIIGPLKEVERGYNLENHGVRYGRRSNQRSKDNFFVQGTLQSLFPMYPVFKNFWLLNLTKIGMWNIKSAHLLTILVVSLLLICSSVSSLLSDKVSSDTDGVDVGVLEVRDSCPKVSSVDFRDFFL